jgi:hypothetical protein
MGLISAAGLAADVPPGVPLIGYQNLVTTGNVSASTESAGFPATNLANPATHLKWKGGVNTAGIELITLNTSSANAIDYVGIVRHNFGTMRVPVSLETTDSPPVVLITPQVFTDNLPILFRFAPQILGGVRIRIDYSANSPPESSLFPPEAAVIYVGRLLVLERSITIGQGHVPISYGRRSSIVNGMSETGNFLGRIVLGEYRQSKAQFEWFTSTFYRASIDAFIAAAQEIPFFWAWSPLEYPAEVGYVWLTNNVEPEVDPVTRRIALTLEMRGIA